MQRKRWSDMSTGERAGLLVLVGVEVAVTAAAAADLARRPAAQVRGAKGWWWPALLVQPVGPIAYLALGRRPG